MELKKGISFLLALICVVCMSFRPVVVKGSVVTNSFYKLAFGEFIDYLLAQGIICGSFAEFLSSGDYLWSQEALLEGLRENYPEYFDSNGNWNYSADVDTPELFVTKFEDSATASLLSDLYDLYCDICGDDSTTSTEKEVLLSGLIANNIPVLNSLVAVNDEVVRGNLGQLDHTLDFTLVDRAGEVKNSSICFDFPKIYEECEGDSLSFELYYSRLEGMARHMGRVGTKGLQSISFYKIFDSITDVSCDDYYSFISYCINNNSKVTMLLTSTKQNAIYYEFERLDTYPAPLLADVYKNSTSETGYRWWGASLYLFAGDVTISECNIDGAFYYGLLVENIDQYWFRGQVTKPKVGSLSSVYVPYKMCDDNYFCCTGELNYDESAIPTDLPVSWVTDLCVDGLIDYGLTGSTPTNFSENIAKVVVADPSILDGAGVGDDVIDDGVIDDGVIGDDVIDDGEDVGKDVVIPDVTTGDVTINLDMDGVEDRLDKIEETLKEEDNDFTNDKKRFIHDIDLTKKFPFCLPFDLVRMISNLVSEREVPKIEVDLSPAFGGSVGQYAFTIDLSQFDKLILILRYMILIGFVVNLIKLTKHIMS